MAKATPKKSTVAAKKPARSKSPDRVKIAEEILQKLTVLNIEGKLKSDLEWCLGSYKYDQNPAGLIEKMTEALTLFRSEKAKKTKGITAKIITDIEKAVAS